MMKRIIENLINYLYHSSAFGINFLALAQYIFGNNISISIFSLILGLFAGLLLVAICAINEC